VGTINEVNLALCESIRQRNKLELPYLLDYYNKSQAYTRYHQIDFATELAHLSGEHHLLPEFLKTLKDYLRIVNG
jgi:hypothetical protein